MREVVLDCETTGISVHQGHRIISLGCVELEHGRITGREREWFFNPGRRCDRDAYNVHRISDRWLAEQPDFRAQHRDIEEFIGEAVIVAHNAPFDRGHLNAEFARLLNMASLTESEANRYPASQWRDSVRDARKMFPGQPNNLDALADRFGVYRGHRIRHGALKDARILAQVWIELRKGGQHSLFDHMPEPEARPKWEPPPFDRAARVPAPSRLTSAEQERWNSVWGETVGKTGIWAEYLSDDAGSEERSGR